jgi:hypothetical protein
LSGAQYTHGATKCKHLNKFFFRCPADVDFQGIRGRDARMKNGRNVPGKAAGYGSENHVCCLVGKAEAAGSWAWLGQPDCTESALKPVRLEEACKKGPCQVSVRP